MTNDEFPNNNAGEIPAENTLPASDANEDSTPAKLSFRDIAFKKDENGKYVVNVIDMGTPPAETPDTSASGYADIYNNRGLYDRPCGAEYEQLVTPEMLRIYEPDIISDPWDRVNALVGLENVKKQLRQIEMRIKFDGKRRQAGLQTDIPSNHFVFMGNPGTGKNEVARILGALLLKAGLLSKGHVVEVDRSDLVGGYIGWSAIKTKQIVEIARGGILFIDEAYALWQDSSWDFGSEVVSTLLKEMEDSRQNFIVVLAGYKNRMDPLIQSNPGLKSRVRHFITFADYTSEELHQIFKKFCSDNHYRLDDSADAALLQFLGAYCRFIDKTESGNARFIRNAFEKTLEKMASRVIGQGLDDIRDFQVIRLTDIPKLEELTGKSSSEYRSISEKLTKLKPKDEE